MAAKQNHSKSLYRLGFFYENGLGDKQDQLKALKYYKFAANQKNDFALLRLASIYSDGEGVDVNVNQAIEYLKSIINKNPNRNRVSHVGKNGNLYIAYNDLGLINLIELRDVEKAVKNIKEAALNEYPFGQNNYGVLLQFYINDIQRSLNFYERSSKEHKFAIADYNLGYYYEMNGDIDQSIQHYSQASENADVQLTFRNRTINDKRCDLSKKFIVCLSNLKLTEYYFSKEPNTSKKYFIKSITMLINDNYKFSYKIENNDDRNMFSYIKYFIFNYPDFGLVDDQIQSSMKEDRTSIKQKIKSKNSNHLVAQNIDDESKFKLKAYKNKIENNENNAFNETNYKFDMNKYDKSIYKHSINDPKDLFEFMEEKEEFKNSFIQEINEIIDDMKKLLYTPPYSILLGRMKIKKSINALHQNKQKHMDHNFYEGFEFNI